MAPKKRPEKIESEKIEPEKTVSEKTESEKMKSKKMKSKKMKSKKMKSKKMESRKTESKKIESLKMKPIRLKLDLRSYLIIIEAAAILIVVALLMRVKSADDTIAPSISFPADTVSYTQGEDVQVLLTGVTAQDEKDGDVTASVSVSAISYSGGHTAIAVYNAKDSHNNVAMATRTINFTPDEKGRFKGAPVNEEMSIVQAIMDDDTSADIQPAAGDSQIPAAEDAGSESQ